MQNLDLTDYVEDACKGIEKDTILYLYKKSVYDEMMERKAYLSDIGLKDEKIFYDLMVSEYPDIRGGYEPFRKKKLAEIKEAKVMKGLAIGSIVFFLLTIAVYVVISLAFSIWSTSWLMFIANYFALIILWLAVAIRKLCQMNRRIFLPIARVLNAVCIMLLMVAAFLFCLILTDMEDTWTIVIMGIMGVLVADGIFAKVTHQKFAIINYFIYIPIFFIMLFVVVAGLHLLSWGTACWLILVGFLADIALAIAIVIDNKRYSSSHKEEDVWKES